MRSEEFVFLLTASANKTANIRIFSGKWYSGCDQIDTSIARQMGSLVGLLQQNVDNGILPCDPRTEYLLLYNVQKSAISSDWLTVDLLIRSQEGSWITKSHLRSDTLVGKPLNLAVNADTLEVVNETEALLRMGLIDESDVAPGKQPSSSSSGNCEATSLPQPIVLGSLHHSSAPVTFLACKAHREQFQPEAIFNGSRDSHFADLFREGRLLPFSMVSDAYMHVISPESPSSQRNRSQNVGPSDTDGPPDCGKQEMSAEASNKPRVPGNLLPVVDESEVDHSGLCHGFILEIKGRRRDVQKIVDQGVGKMTSKVIEIPTGEVTATTNTSAAQPENNVMDQFKRLKTAYPGFQVPDAPPPSSA
eukprot:ANDGO_04521.mRNA.1 hypothetical protein